MDPGSIHSYHRFMWENLFSQLDIPREQLHIPRGDLPRDEVEAELRRYEAEIREAGGIDLQILGIGRTGHIGFNEPGSGAESRTRLVTLDLVTRQDAAADFFGEENVPREAITMGVATILEAREILILATGEHKAAIVRRAVEGEVDYEVAATFLQQHPDTTFYIDRAAAAALTREATPWLLGRGRVDARADGPGRRVAVAPGRQGDPQADPARLRRAPAVVAGGAARLAGRAQRPGLQRARRQDPGPLEAAARPARDLLLAPSGRRRDLDGRDPAEAGRERERDHRRLHDQRQHGRVRPRRPPAPGLLRRLASERAHRRGGGGRAALGRRVDAFLAAKRPGDVDIPEVLDAKRIIRETEAVAGIRTLGLRGRARPGSSTCRSTRRAWSEGAGRAGGRRDRARPARGGGARSGLRRRRPVRPARHAPDVQGGDRPRAGRVSARRADGGRRCGSTEGRGRSGRSPRPPGWCRSRRKSCGSRSRRSSSTRARRTRRRFRGPTSGSSGSGSRRGTRDRGRRWTGWAWRNTSRWRRTSRVASGRGAVTPVR